MKISPSKITSYTLCVCNCDVCIFVGVDAITLTVNGGTDNDNDGVFDVMMGRNFSITCVLNYPATSITWRKNGVVISNSTIKESGGFSVEYFSNSNGQFTSSVLTKASELNDTAVYQCSTTFQTIQSNGTVSIAVYGKCSM